MRTRQSDGRTVYQYTWVLHISLSPNDTDPGSLKDN